MLLRFRVSNHASLRAEQEISLIAGDAADSDESAVRPLPGSDLQVLPVVAVFGANASGKSNLVHALAFMQAAVVDSHQGWRPGQAVPRRPFAFDPADRQRPSVFAVEILLDGVRHEYGFAVSDRRVEEEWLYDFPKAKRRMLFERDDEGIRIGPGFRGRRKVVEDVVRPNSLFLSAGAANNNPLLLRVYEWFTKRLRLAVDSNYAARLTETIALRQGPQQQLLRDLLAYADLGVSGLELVDHPLDDAVQERLLRAMKAIDPDGFDEAAADPLRRFQRVQLEHTGAAGPVSLDLSEESNGTQTWVGLLGPVLGALSSGAVLVVDELDARLHPRLAARLVALFQDGKANPNGAQLLFNTHDATLLAPTSDARLRRDQVWFTEKGADGGTTLTALLDYRPRRDGAANLERGYLAGRYGGLPFFDDDLLGSLLGSVRGSEGEVAAG